MPISDWSTQNYANLWLVSQHKIMLISDWLFRDSSDGVVTRFFELSQAKSKLDIEELWQSVFDEKMTSGVLNQARIAKNGVLIKNLSNMAQVHTCLWLVDTIQYYSLIGWTQINIHLWLVDVYYSNLWLVDQKWELAQQLDSALETMTSLQQINALQQAGVQWYHEEFIPRDANIKLAEPIRWRYEDYNSSVQKYLIS